MMHTPNPMHVKQVTSQTIVSKITGTCRWNDDLSTMQRQTHLLHIQFQHTFFEITDS